MSQGLQCSTHNSNFAVTGVVKKRLYCCSFMPSLCKNTISPHSPFQIDTATDDLGVLRHPYCQHITILFHHIPLARPLQVNLRTTVAILTLNDHKKVASRWRCLSSLIGGYFYRFRSRHRSMLKCSLFAHLDHCA